MTEETPAPPTVEWHPFDYGNKPATKPPHTGWVWIVEEFYTQGVEIGYFDGFTFRNSSGSDDCSVSHWAEIAYPQPPGGALGAEPKGGDD